MTHVGGSISVVIGGFSLTTDWSNNTFIYDHGTKEWMVDTEATGAVPAGNDSSLRLSSCCGGPQAMEWTFLTDLI